MSATKLPRGLAGMVATGASHVVRHPVESAAYAVGLVRGAATAAMRVASGEPVRDDRSDRSASTGTTGNLAGVDPSAVDAEATTSAERPREPERVGLEPGERMAAEAEELPPPPIPTPGEVFDNEPKASSRDSMHGGPGDDSDLDSTNWREDVDGGPDVTTPVGTTGAGEGFNPDTAETDLQQPDTEPLMDPSLTKQIKSESETLSRAAEKDPDG